MFSVTQVIAGGGLQAQVAAYYTPESADLGTELHHATERLDRDEPIGILHADNAARLDGYQTFLAIAKPQYLQIEHRLVNEDLRVGGRVDRVCARLFGHPAVIDIKRGLPQPWHGQQLWAYWYLAGADPTMRRFGLYLTPTGYKLKPYTDPLDAHKFLAAHAHMMRTGAAFSPG